MKGNNTITMNEATIIAAVQMYLDAQYREGSGQVVNSVKPVATGRYGDEGCFDVKVSEPEKAAPRP